MIRTNTVNLTTLKGVAYRQKTKHDDIALVIVMPDVKQPGIATISKRTGKPVLLKNINEKDYPMAAFEEAMRLTNGMPYRKLGSVKVTADMFYEEVQEPEEVTKLNEEAYQKILDHYTDKNGKLSYELINKEMIKFAKSSSVVRNMIAEKATVKQLNRYITFNKLRNVAENPNLTDKEVEIIVELLDEAYLKGVFKDLNSELKNMLKKQ